MTLSEFSLQVRIMAKLLVITFLGILFFYLLVLVLLKTLVKPSAPQLAINPVFGSIKKPDFEEALANKKYEFILDTINGTYPETTKSAAVYFIPEPKSTLAYLAKIESLARSFNFDTSVYEPQTLSEQWIKYEDQSRVLEINIVSSHFKYYHKSGPVLESLVEATPEARFILLENQFIEKARQGMVQREAYPTHLATGTNNPVYQSYDTALNRFVAYKEEEPYPKAVRVDFFRKDEAINIISPLYFSSQNFAILAPLNYSSEIVEMQFTSFAKLDEEPGIYPLLTSEEAFQKLQEGQASVISIKEEVIEPIKIRSIELGYYDPLTYQPYFQPIFVFLGSDNFVAYLPAIRDEYLLK